MKSHGHSISRRDFLKLTAYSLLIGSLTVAGGAEYATQIEPAWLDVNRLPLRLPRLDPAFSGFRLAQISDIHMGGWMNRERLDKVVQAVLAELPDVVAITGDYLLGHGWDEAREQALDDLSVALKPLVDFSPTLTVMGNHDYWTDVKENSSQVAQYWDTRIIEFSLHLQRGMTLFPHLRHGRCVRRSGSDG